ncbi:hypothetical protein ASG68_20380 [Rhizobium sp. Leaf453]|nr:hypothetical protein ASG42_16520 [Rhizobium sp. Leaf391]KQT00619.1 hypothetical protein ASG50_19505 [Rhizobium sp. Leaf386]KQU09092.1 hypothetical protein ASG68_20380 [Rhizobium sp. Leaf453]
MKEIDEAMLFRDDVATAVAPVQGDGISMHGDQHQHITPRQVLSKVPSLPASTRRWKQHRTSLPAVFRKTRSCLKEPASQR